MSDEAEIRNLAAVFDDQTKTSAEIVDALEQLLVLRQDPGRDGASIREILAQIDSGFGSLLRRNRVAAEKWLHRSGGKFAESLQGRWRQRILAASPEPVADLATFPPILAGSFRTLMTALAQAPPAHTLHPPASLAMIEDNEARLGRRLPEDTRYLFRFSNGMWLFQRRIILFPIETISTVERRGDPELFELFSVEGAGTICREAEAAGAWHFYAHGGEADAADGELVRSFRSLEELINALIAAADLATGTFSGFRRARLP